MDNDFEYTTLRDFSLKLADMTEEQLLSLSDLCSIANDFLKLNRSHLRYADNRIRTHLRLRKLELESQYLSTYNQMPPRFELWTDYLELQDEIFNVIQCAIYAE